MFAIKSYDGIVRHPTYNFIKRNIFTGHVDKQLLGIADSFNNITVTYPDNVLRLRTPFTYLDSTGDDYTVNYGNVSGAGHAAIKADGYGSLQLPGASYSNVLRIRTTYDEMDTTVAGPAFFVTHLQGFKYEWYDDLHRSPLLTWDSTSVTSQGGSSENKSVFYLASENTTGITHVGGQTLQLIASFHHNLLNVNGHFIKGREYFVQLYDISGKYIFSVAFVATSNNWETAIDNALSECLYVLSIKDQQGNMGVAKLHGD